MPEPVQKVTERKEIEATRNEPKPPVPEEKPDPKPEQKPEPPKPQPKADAKPEPKPEQKIDPIAEALEKADQKPKKEEPKKQAEAPQVPTPPKKPPAKPQPKFDPSKISALLDKRDPQRQAATGDTINRTASLGVPTGNAATLSQSEIDALRAQIQACWNPPPGALDARELVVTGASAAQPRRQRLGRAAGAQSRQPSAIPGRGRQRRARDPPLRALQDADREIRHLAGCRGDVRSARDVSRLKRLQADHFRKSDRPRCRNLLFEILS